MPKSANRATTLAINAVLITTFTFSLGRTASDRSDDNVRNEKLPNFDDRWAGGI
jgi:hypothetical protein